MSYHRQQFKTPSPATSSEIERLLYHMPTVAQCSDSEWAAGFAKSILGHCKRRGWKPSPKQLGMMRSLVADLFTDTGEDDFNPIES